MSPPTFALRVNLPTEVHFSYQRYLLNTLRHGFGFAGSPMRMLYRKSMGRGAESRPRRSQEHRPRRSQERGRGAGRPGQARRRA